MAMGFERFALLEAHNTHRHVVLARRATAERLLPLRLGTGGNLIGRPSGPFEFINVYGSWACHGSAFVGLVDMLQPAGLDRTAKPGFDVDELRRRIRPMG
jgi:hypothetical protein